MTQISERLEVAQRDTTFDGIVPKSVWISTRTTEKRDYILVIIELNGIEKEIDRIYVGNYDGILSSSHNLTWLLSNASRAKKALEVAVEALDKINKMNRQTAVDKYGDASKADNWGCIKVGEPALAKISEILGER